MGLDKILEAAYEKLGWLSEDEKHPISKAGLLALLTHFNLITRIHDVES